MADHYEIARNNARAYFLEQDRSRLCLKPGVTQKGGALHLTFLGTRYRVDLETGVVFGQTEADFEESLSIYDWLFHEGGGETGEFCPVNALPGVYVRGSGLTMGAEALAEAIDQNPQGFRRACGNLGGESLPLGDMAYRLPVFPDLHMLVKFYHRDEDFPPQLTFLWDKKTLHFLRDETVYYVAGCLRKTLARHLNGTTPAG